MKHVLSYWSFDGWSVALLLAMVAYGVLTHSSVRLGYLLMALLLSVVCLLSPLQVLSAHYLFSAHMAVHVLLLLGVGPLLVMSLPANHELFSSFFLFLKRHPVMGWLTGIGIMWWWHTPLVFNTAMTTTHHQSLPLVAVVEVLSLVLAGILFSAPVLHPNQRFRIEALSGVVYLFTACVGCSLLGLLITFAPVGIYHHFLSQHDAYDLNPIIIKQWGITQAVDQQAAGLIMWVPCCLLYVSGAMYLLVRWLNQKETSTMPLNKV